MLLKMSVAPVASATVTASIADQSSLVAPAAVFLLATPVSGFTLSTAPSGTPYEPWRHEITYQWTVRTSPLTFERSASLNMPADWKDANVYYGPEAAIVFDAPGTYHIDLVAVDGDGNVGTDSVENIVVTSQDAAFPTTATIAVSDGSDFTGAPAGANTINLGTGSWSDVNSAITSRGDADTRVLMKAGVDFRSLMTVGDQFDFFNITSSEVAVGSFGAGAKPIIPLCKKVGNANEAVIKAPRDNTASTVKIRDLDLRSGWEADKERGYIGGQPVWRDTQTDILFHRCLISGADKVVTQARSGASWFVWSDGQITNWADMGVYYRKHLTGTDKHLAIIGSDIHQHADARQGNNKSGHQNQHGCLRAEQNEKLYLHAVSMFSRNGWSTGYGGTPTADQPCIRINSEGVSGAKTIADRVSLEGGWQVLNITGQDAGAATPDTPGNHVFDKLLTVGTPETKVHIECKFGGVTVRNGLAVEFNVPKYSGGINTGMYEFNSDDTVVSSNRDTPISSYNCTFVSLLSTANNRNLNGGALADIPGVFHSGEFVNYTENNHITYMPNQTTPDTANPVSVTAMSGFTPQFKGTAESIVNISVTGDGTDTLTIPYASLLDKDGNTTDQAFWNARVAAGSTLHHLSFGGLMRFSDLGEFTVTFNASDVDVVLTTGVFTNLATVTVKLDQSDTLAAPNATYATTGETMPESRLISAVDIDALSTYAPYDFVGDKRRGSGLSGAPSGTTRKGAYEEIA